MSREGESGQSRQSDRDGERGYERRIHGDKHTQRDERKTSIRVPYVFPSHESVLSGKVFFISTLSGARSKSSEKETCTAKVPGNTNRAPPPDQEHELYPATFSPGIQFLSEHD